MARINSFISLSSFHGIDPIHFDKAGIFDPLLSADTPLFIDPLLLAESSHHVISVEAKKEFEEYFYRVLILIKRIKYDGDIYDDTVFKQLLFPEVKGLCLGYGSSSVQGRGAGKKLTQKLQASAKEIVAAGYEDPYLFTLLSVLGAGFGADRISDMTARVIENSLCKFTQIEAKKLGIPTQEYRTVDGIKFKLPKNPIINSRLLLLPLDILRKLPIAKDWESAMDAASENYSIRQRVNQYIGNIFQSKTKKDKKAAFDIAKNKILTNASAFSAAMEMFNAVEKSPYDYKNDPDGYISWRRLIHSVSENTPKSTLKSITTANDAIKIVEDIIQRFKYWIEERRASKELWDSNGKPRKEKTAQTIFFMIADEFCRQNGLDISPETDSGGGPVDFKFSVGYDNRIVVEIKLSTNTKLLTGLTNQIEAYRDAEDAKAAFYVIIDVGAMGNKISRINIEKNKFNYMGKRPTDIIVIDGKVRPSASKL